ncbi:MAG TPA: ABC transporter ATP-binding protein [Polyangiaceae bacterium]|nr:ABC transporter ATP-binding protein [Polyangiaceae bacterium]
MTSQAMPTDGLIVDAHALVKSYGRADVRLEVLNGVDICVRPREIVALQGRSGSGKSTLLNILGCLDRPDGGAYHLGGQDVSTLGREAQAWVRLHYIGFVFQSFHLIARSTALENVEMPLYYAGVGPKERRRLARTLLERMQLGDRVDHVPSELSGGQRQRVAIARALACGPKLLLADEPTGALDTRGGAEILAILRELRDTEGLTVIIVTHDDTVAKAADRRIRLLDGRIVTEEEYAAEAS